LGGMKGVFDSHPGLRFHRLRSVMVILLNRVFALRSIREVIQYRKIGRDCFCVIALLRGYRLCSTRLIGGHRYMWSFEMDDGVWRVTCIWWSTICQCSPAWCSKYLPRLQLASLNSFPPYPGPLLPTSPDVDSFHLRMTC
jgi:hypothetical protein